MRAPQSVLIVDDDPTICRWISAVLASLQIETVSAGSGVEALGVVAERSFDLALLDVFMPGMDGYALADALQADDPSDGAAMPVIFLTAADDTAAKVKAFDRGAVDYIVKPFEPKELVARVRSALRTQALVEELEVQSKTDQLTGLLNRKALVSAVDNRLTTLRAAQASPADGFSLLFLDLDRFKVINDSLGHAVGDQLLIAIAEWLRAYLAEHAPPPRSPTGPRPVIARLGGDEFVLVFDGITDAQRIRDVAHGLVSRLSQPMKIGGETVAVGASIGIRIVTGGSHGVSAILRDADTAMYHAKNAGRDRATLFDQSMHEQAIARLSLEQDLKQAIDSDQIELYYQPIMCLKTNRIIRFEALVRWNHPRRGLLNPDAFITVAEETGLILPLGDQITALACRQIRAWYDVLGRANTPPVNVNLSPRQLYGPGLVRNIKRHLKTTGIDVRHLGIELTESSLIYDQKAAEGILSELHRMGVYLSLDDFGTGYSSMDTLRRYPFSAFKIDRSFTATMVKDRTAAAIINAMVTLAYNLRLNVVAEGVENIDEIQQLQGMDCYFAQGYLISHPVNAETATRLYRERGQAFFSQFNDAA